MPGSIHVDRLELSVRGVDAPTVQAALAELGPALARELAPGRRALGGGAPALGARPSPGEVAQAMARQVAVQLRRAAQVAGVPAGSGGPGAPGGLGAASGPSGSGGASASGAAGGGAA